MANSHSKNVRPPLPPPPSSPEATPTADTEILRVYRSIIPIHSVNAPPRKRGSILNAGEGTSVVQAKRPNVEVFGASAAESELWDIIGGSDTTPPTDVEAAKRLKTKAGKTMYALTVTIEDEFLQRIKNAKTPKEAWDTLAMIFTKKTDARLQRLENENVTISQYFSKVKSLSDEISKSDLENAIIETRMRRIIVHGLRPEYQGIITATWGRPKESTSKSQRQNKQTRGFNNWQMEKCYNCRKKGHYARDCWYKKAKGNIATSSQNQKDEEEVSDFETSYVVKETNQQEELVTCQSNKEEEITLATVNEKLVDY
ncbi:hypothetical protein H5410_015519 [Solanum commersonii]|uniref:CCHC-type domain-containing protein n=1 Tax=Solanum commersonii TaxID=4109 RepID=A0A9J5ZUR5_SOLCO|nr:hypothetical protein H5410_015519 [Solanum commersonii]